MPKLSDYFKNNKIVKISEGTKNSILIRPDEWTIKLKLKEGNYCLMFFGSYKDNLVRSYLSLFNNFEFNLTKCNIKKHDTIGIYDCIHFTGGELKISNNFRFREGNGVNNIKSDAQIKNIDDLYNFLKKNISLIRFNYNNNGKTLDFNQFLKEGGVCEHFSCYLTEVLRHNKITTGTVTYSFIENRTIDDELYFKSFTSNSLVPHAWVYFILNNKFYVCDPTIWSSHSNPKWLMKYGLYELREAWNNKRSGIYLLLFAKEYLRLFDESNPDKNLLLTDLKVS